ncbi:MAG: hypothetical protein IJU76_10460 [Desulfovibrionaceae bacterium]|nr:hypothetical protein [Desulfovibrionaceae bacterium]
MIRLLVSVLLIFASPALGYFYRVRELRKTDSAGAENRLASLRNRLQFLAFFVLLPLSSMLSLWGMSAPDGRLLLFPILGILAWSSGGALALCAARLLRFSPKQTGSLFCCGTFSNIGAIGTLVCVVFFGEESIAWVALYRLCEEAVYYGIAMPIAARYRGSGAAGISVQGFRLTRLIVCVLFALGLGILFNMLGIRRPECLSDLATVMSVSAAVLALFSIGLGLRLKTLGHYPKSCLCIAAIKFLLVPLFIGSLAYAAGFQHVADGLPFKICLVLASMPVAMNALIPPALLSLDLDLANACWIVSTVALLIVLPVLALGILPLFS